MDELIASEWQVCTLKLENDLDKTENSKVKVVTVSVFDKVSPQRTDWEVGIPFEDSSTVVVCTPSAICHLKFAINPKTTCIVTLKWLKVAQLSLKLSELKNRSEPTELPAPDLNKLVSEGTISLFARQVENEGPDFLKI